MRIKSLKQGVQYTSPTAFLSGCDVSDFCGEDGSGSTSISHYNKCSCHLRFDVKGIKTRQQQPRHSNHTRHVEEDG